jgi:metal-responsive CopG/Arc/MetJ family transcriptional regulator
MRHSVSISLPNEIFKRLKLESKQEKANWSEIIRKALREYFFHSEFVRLHKRARLEYPIAIQLIIYGAQHQNIGILMFYRYSDIF